MPTTSAYPRKVPSSVPAPTEKFDHRITHTRRNTVTSTLRLLTGIPLDELRALYKEAYESEIWKHLYFGYARVSEDWLSSQAERLVWCAVLEAHGQYEPWPFITHGKV
ncbi:hypothetical protein ANO14919_075330 [Xylariales sp. No.14919]|nr:hypothetical protein ANO14919_075330 [Xylariales sp. No.14919]